MPESLEYETPTVSSPGPWYTRIPWIVLFLMMLVPSVVFSRGGRTIPGEKWRFDEIVLPALGCPIAMTLAVLSYPRSSNRRRVGLLIILAFGVLGIAGMTLNAMTHW